jgi:prepilin-type N-terminal cleavage/methylation domain-containing protein
MRKGFVRCWDGFTLIELLIVVAIIAILAAIAVPNFLQAQTRAKVSRVTSDHRSLTIALEQYRVDNGVYVPHIDDVSEFYLLTTPVAYMNSVPRCPFAAMLDSTGLFGIGYHMETDLPVLANGAWPDPGRTIASNLVRTGRLYLIWSIGPDLTHNLHTMGEYDPTNGVKSYGDIFRPGP